MIREFSVRPKPSNNRARIIFSLSMSLALALILLSTFIPMYQGIVSLLGVASLTIGLMIYTKYISPIYFYDITFDSSSTPILVVRQQIGKRYTTLCRISLAEIVKVEKENRKQRHEHKTAAGVIKYIYMPTLDPAESYRITTSGRHERAEILIESSDGFAELLKSYSAEARAMGDYNDEY